MNTASLALALVAGAVAAFNPCGFALLPAYLGLLVAGDSDERGGRLAAMGRAVRFAAGMTVGFVVVFGLAGAVLAPLAFTLQRYLPWLTIVIGAALLVTGAWLLSGRSLGIPGLAGYGASPTARWSSQIGYGVAFALASLSCSIAPFLGATVGSLAAGGAVAVAGSFLAFAVGMGTVVLVLALAVAGARSTITARMRRAAPVISRVSGLLLLVAGAYVGWYGWYEVRVFEGQAGSDPVVSAATGLQQAVVRGIEGLGSGSLLAVAGVLAVAVLAVLAVRRSRSRRVPARQEAGVR